MTRTTPGQAVDRWFRRMGELSSAEPATGPPSSDRLTRPTSPVLASIRILKRRAIPGREIDAISYRDTSGDPWFWIVRLAEDDDGSWRACGASGGSGPDPDRATPWINLAGVWGAEGLAFGGRVAGAGAERAASARLRLGDTVLVDDVAEGVALFVTSDPAAGTVALVELLAADGSVLWQDEVELDD